MALLPKKPKAKASAPLVPAWHPNFRNFERLPDTKVVRTSFFINVAALFVTLMVVIYTAYAEYNLHSLGGAIEELQQGIDKNRPGSERAVAQFKKFQDEEKRLLESVDFSSGKFVPSAFLLHLGDTLPLGIAIRQIDYRATGVIVRGTVRGSPDEASGVLAAYSDRQLPADKEFVALFEDVTVTSQVRSQETGWLTFELLLKFKGAAKEAKK